jgi:hypothetical protein
MVLYVGIRDYFTTAVVFPTTAKGGSGCSSVTVKLPVAAGLHEALALPPQP